MGNQYYLIIENPLEQNDTVNFGFRVDNLFGNDWQFNHMQGLFNGAFPPDHFAGYDLAQLYGEVHLPILTTGGLDVKGGALVHDRRLRAGAGDRPPAALGPLHVQLRPTVHPRRRRHHAAPDARGSTCTTARSTAGTAGSNEHYKWGYIGGFSLDVPRTRRPTSPSPTSGGPTSSPASCPATSRSIRPATSTSPAWPAAPTRATPHNDRTLFTTVLTHKWTDKLTQVIETDQAWEQNVPGLASERPRTAPPAPPTGTASATGSSTSSTPKLTGVWRSEVFWDPTGVRTGYADTYYEMTLGLIYKPKHYIWIRPEARYDWAQFGKPYSDDTRSSQFTLGFDVDLPLLALDQRRALVASHGPKDAPPVLANRQFRAGHFSIETFLR